MASEREATFALETHEGRFRSLGAQTVAVAEVGRGRRKTYGIVALFDDLPIAVPKTLDVTVSNKVIAVPIVVTSREAGTHH